MGWDGMEFGVGTAVRRPGPTGEEVGVRSV